MYIFKSPFPFCSVLLLCRSHYILSFGRRYRRYCLQNKLLVPVVQGPLSPLGPGWSVPLLSSLSRWPPYSSVSAYNSLFEILIQTSLCLVEWFLLDPVIKHVVVRPYGKVSQIYKYKFKFYLSHTQSYIIRHAVKCLLLCNAEP